MNQKKVRLIFTILVALILIAFVFSLVAPAVFAQFTELEYPQIPGGAEPPNKVRGLPNFIKYAFNLGIAIAGLAAFISFVYGGVRYLASAGNPGVLSDAREQIKASLLGLVLLLGSWLLLTTINPKLVVLKIDKGGGDRQGIILFAPGITCNTGANNTEGRKEGEDFLRVKNSKSDVTKLSVGEKFPRVGKVQFLNSSEQIGLNLYSEDGYRPNGSPVFRSSAQSQIAAGACVDVNKDIGSIEIVWKVPGVYLFASINCQGEDVRAYTGDTASLGDFDNKAQSLKIIPAVTKVSLFGPFPEDTPEENKYANVVTNKLGAILFEKDGAQNDGAVFLGGGNLDQIPAPAAECINIAGRGCGQNNPGQEPYCKDSVVNDISSLKVFNQYLPYEIIAGQTIKTDPPSGDGVTLFGNYDFNEQDPGSSPKSEQQIYCGPINATTAPDLANGKPLWVDSSTPNFNSQKTYPGEQKCGRLLSEPWTSSIKVAGDYIAVLFRSDGRAEVFKAPGDYRLRENHIGDDKAQYLLVIPIKR